ncbi:hypothetical protein SAICODRAFT_20499 [Saitoella complicata NRRL Y-17804]|nr:uncharacterized protein SAICODRAFT_20499 [Saitoella complicata NRRL Y-17804]ODQ51474.1 hypothetical protein SAICODRAFT_20499 [Saitoella complicata NRRL Y-17804]
MAPSPPFSVRALHAYTSDHDDDLTFDAGDVITVTSIEDEEWYFGKVGGREGMFPKNFVGEVEEEAQEEEEEEVAEPIREEVHDPEPEEEDEEEEEVVAAPVKPAGPKAADIAAQEELIRAASPPPPVSEPTPVAAPPPVAAATKPAPLPTITTNLPSTPKSNPPSATSDKPSPSTGGGSSFRDRIAAFNKSADAPIAPKPMQKPSSFVKKPFVPPPPSAAAYTSTPAVPKPEQLRKHEVVHPPPPAPVVEREAAHDASSSLSRTSSMEAKEEDAPKAGSLRDRIAALQQSRLNPMGGPPPPKPKPAAKPTPRESVDSERKGSMEEVPRRMSSESRKSTLGTPGKERPSFTGEREESAISEEPEEVGEEVMVPGTAAPVEKVESHTSHPDLEAPAHSPAHAEEETVQHEEEEAEEQEEIEEDVDPEVARRIALRERMAKMSGGMGMMGMALGMPPPPPAVKSKPKHALEHVERHEEDVDDRSMAPVPILPGMGPPPAKIAAPHVVQHEAEVEREEEEEENEEEGERIREIPADEVRDVEDLHPAMPSGAPVHEEEEEVVDLGLPPVPVAAAAAAAPLAALMPPARAPAPPSPSREVEPEVVAPPPPNRAAAPPAPIAVPPVPTRITEDSEDGVTSPPPMSPPTAASKRLSYVGGSGMRPAIPMSPPATKTSAPMSPPLPANLPPQPTQHEEQYKLADHTDGAGLGITGPTESTESYVIEDPELISAAKHANILSKALDLGEPLSTSPVSPTFPRQASMEAPRGVPPPPPGAMRRVPPLPPVAPPVPAKDEEEYEEVEEDEEEEEEEEELVPPPQAVQQGAIRAPPPPPPSGLPQRDVPPPPPPSMMIDAPHTRAAPPPPPLSPPPVRDMPAPPPVMAPPAAPQESLSPMPSAIERIPTGDYRTSTEVSYTPSIGLNRANTQSRRSLDYGGGPNAHIAREVDLGRMSMWWTQPNTPPPVFQNRPKDLIFEIDESTQTRRGGHSIVTKDVYVLFQDYSQTVVSAQFDAQNPSQVELSQTHKPPPPQLSQMALEDAWARFGARVQEAAAGFAGKVVGAGDAFTFVRDVVAKIPDALRSPGTRSWGALVYANLANASVIQHDEIRAGDIITFRNTKFQGHKGGLHTKYAMEVGKPEHVAIVFEWDGTKKKVRAWEQGREGKKVEKVSYKLGDLKSGEVRIWRVIGKGYVGWE